jgi:hypothetical protein
MKNDIDSTNLILKLQKMMFDDYPKIKKNISPYGFDFKRLKKLIIIMSALLIMTGFGIGLLVGLLF